jgi:hypothetical protein
MPRPLIVAVCPAGVITGGPEAQHQLVDMANDLVPGSAYICYHPFDQTHDVPEAYRVYDTPTMRRDEIPAHALVVMPEIWALKIETFTQRCAFWWLSVDNFWDFGTESDDVKTDAMRKAAVQLAQSDYARRYVEKKFGLESLMLTDYINTSFRDTAEVAKLPRVAVNPAKGKHLIDVFAEWYPDIELIELAAMSRDEVAAELAASSIYIDFGHHPGRDRMPREAALSGVVVITTNTGAAANHVDMPINRWYKVTTMEEVGERVHEVLHDLPRHVAAQAHYREVVQGQRAVFRREVQQLLDFAATDD